MNCQSFENIVTDIAREQMLDATQRDEAMLHTGVCKACSTRLNEEVLLTQSLQDLSAAMREVRPRLNVEDSLRAQFRQRGRRAVGGPTIMRRYGLYAAAAALLLAMMGIAAIRLRNHAPVNALSEQVPKKEQPVAAMPNGGNDQSRVLAEAPVKSPLYRPRKHITQPREVKTVLPTAVDQTQVASSAVREVATDFLPIGYATTVNVQDGGQVLRVEMPRSAMARFGLPVNMDRYDERVKADVLVSPDGLARAIRFVQ